MAKIESAPTKGLLIDTHVIIWLASNERRLASTAQQLIEESFHGNRLAASVISAWEIGVLCAKNRLSLTRPPLVWFEEVAHNFRINILEITPAIAINSSYFPGGFHADPADRIVVATALAHDLSLVTADANILKYSKAGHLKTIAAL